MKTKCGRCPDDSVLCGCLQVLCCVVSCRVVGKKLHMHSQKYREREM